MSKSETILLGYDLWNFAPVFVENTHILVTGLTNKSGKTTAIEALATRSGRKVLVFLTKPGEAVFANARLVPPFYQEKSDWQYVSSILEAVMKERMRFERAWIIRATKGTRSLKEVDANCQNLAQLRPEGSLENNVFSTLHAYFEIVLPQLKRISFTPTFPNLEVGINVMNLTGMGDEVQSLVIRACLDHISQEEEGVITVIPELWKFAPEGRGNPVKQALEFLIRQGATRKNFVWMDSQDIAGVDKLPLKQVYTWLLGLQTERNEVKHTLDQIPLPKKSKPGTDEIMTLEVGRFILATPKGVVKLYVMPAWMDERTAQNVARGFITKLPDPPVGRQTLAGSLRRAETVVTREKLDEPLRSWITDEPKPHIEPPKPEPEKIQLVEKTLLVEVIQKIEPVATLSTDQKEGAIVATLWKNENKPMSIADLCRGMAEYGVRQIETNFRRDVGNDMIGKGWLVEDGRCYRLPRFVKFGVTQSVIQS